MDGLKRLINSSKFWVALMGMVSIVLVQGLNVTPETASAVTKAILALASAYIIGTSIEDTTGRNDTKSGGK